MSPSGKMHKLNYRQPWMTKASLISSKQKESLYALYLKDMVAKKNYTNYQNKSTIFSQQRKKNIRVC